MNATQGFGWSSRARAGWPRWKAVALIELGLSVCVISVVAGVIFEEGQRVIGKARLTEALHHANQGRIRVAEHFAETGRPLATDASGEMSRRSEGDSPEYEKHLSPAVSLATAAGGSGRPTVFALIDGAADYSRAGVVDGSVVAIGRMRESERPYRLVFSPRYQAGGSSPVMFWTCGNYEGPPGLLRLGEPQRSDIPARLLPAACRAEAP